MKEEEVLACSFSTWYEMFKNVTEESIIIPLPQHFLDYLHTDGVVLPESSAHGIHQGANLAMDGDEDDPDIRDDELMKMYEDDWSTPSCDKTSSQAPEFGTFDTQVKEAIKTLGGRAFPKLNWSSPKDASWISFDKTLMCTCPCDVYLLMKSSQFVSHDLDMPFSGCENSNEDSEAPKISYVLVLRRWQAPHPASEFRCFVKNKNIIGICQRNMEKFYKNILQEKDSIIEDILKFFSKKIVDIFPLSNYVIDVTRKDKTDVQLIDFNPWGPVTDALMFEWEEIDAMSIPADTWQKPEFRCVMSEEGIKSAMYAKYALPKDIVDLTVGEDPQKLIDLMKLKIQNPGESDSSSDEDQQ